MIDFTRYVAERTQYFVGRRWVFEGIHDWLAQPLATRYFLVTGEPGSGKTALAARLYQFSKGESPPNGFDLLGAGSISATHFCSARDSSWVDPRTFATSIALQLSRFPEYALALKDTGDKSITINVSARVSTAEANAQIIGVVIENLDISRLSAQDAFNRVVIDPLLAIYGNGFQHPITILVDSLDEALTHAGEVNIVRLLSNLESLPPEVRFILTSRREERVESKFPVADGILLSAPEYSDHNRQDINAYVRRRLNDDPELFPKVAAIGNREAELLAQAITSKAADNFQYAAFVLNAMAKGQLPLSNPQGLPPGLDGLYYGSLERAVELGKRDWAQDYAAVMGVLSVAQASLSLAQLQEFAGQTESAVWTSLSDLQQFVEEVQPHEPEGESRYSLYHQSVIDFFRRRQIRLEKKTLNNRFYLSDQQWHRSVADFFLKQPPSAWDEYGLRYTPTHLAEAARSSLAFERHRSAESLVRLLADSAFRAEHNARLHDVPLMQHDLEQSVRVAATVDDAAGLPLVAESALALVDFRRRELRPEPLIELARLGEIDDAVRRLDLFDVDAEWRQIVLLLIAWWAADCNPGAARKLRDRISEIQPLAGEVSRLLAFLDAALGITARPGPGALPPPPPKDVVEAVVARMGGAGNAATELLAAHGLPDVRNPSLRGNLNLLSPGDSGYLAKFDGPPLVSYAVASPDDGDRLLRQYIRIHTNYHYVQYRQRSLALLLDAVMQHPVDLWIRQMASELACSALAGSRVDFQQALPWMVLALEATSQPAALQALEGTTDKVLSAIGELTMARGTLPSSGSVGSGDPLASYLRQLTALAEAFRLLNRPEDATKLLQRAISLPYGFAGFRSPACLTLAEAIHICQPAIPNALQSALASSLQAAHNVQDPMFCARVTARVNAMRLRWWEGAYDVPSVIPRFCREPDAPEFCPVHLIGETFCHRAPDSMELPNELLDARNLAGVADAFHYSWIDLARLNPDLPFDDALAPGTPVNLPDPGFATLLAACLSAAVLGDTSLPSEERIALIRKLVPVASANPTALDTILARLLAVARPSTGEVLGKLKGLAAAAIVPQAILEGSLPA